MTSDGIYNVSDFMKNITSAYMRGEKKDFIFTGWPTFAKHYKPEPGYMTVVTGIPGHGKSEIIDALLVNLSHLYGHKNLYFSPENYPLEKHFIKLAEKYIGKPFRPGPVTDGMSHDDLRDSIEWIQGYFQWLYPIETECKIDFLLDKAQKVFDSTGLNNFVIDPWNEVDHQRPTNLSETEYISQSLSKVRRFARKNKVHCFIIAHPTKLPKDKTTGKYDPPTAYDISGSAHWRNKADFTLTAHRHDMGVNGITIYIGKVKFKDFGKIGECELDYDFSTGRFKEKNQYVYRLPTLEDNH
jgi:twinkle protein